MTTMLPSPFLTDSPAPVETVSSVPTVVEASAPVSVPTAGVEAETFLDVSHVHEIFHFSRKLVDEAARNQSLLAEVTREWSRARSRQNYIDGIGLDAVAGEIEAWQNDADPLPLFLRGA